MEREKGIEPSYPACSALPLFMVGGVSLTEKNLEREKGIEPSYPAWKASVLPLNYSRAKIFHCDAQKD